MRIVKLLFMLFAVFMANSAFATCVQMSSGWCYPTGTSSLGNFLGFAQKNPDYQNWSHLAKDVQASHGTSVYTIGDGYVSYVKKDQGNYGGVGGRPGGVVIITHLTTGDVYIDALYGHLENIVVSVGQSVNAGQKIGEINNYVCGGGSPCPHLHFSVGFSASVDRNLQIAGYTAKSFGTNDTIRGIVNPFVYLGQSSNGPYMGDINGNQEFPNDAIGALGGGGIRVPTEQATPNLPNFVINRNWLETVGGVEQYVYAKTDEIKMKGQFKNVGSGEIPNDATIHSRVYLSKGYKEDDHDDWISVGVDETRGDSLDIGETHTETEGLKLWEYSEIKLGKTYNIVWCIDRIADQNNGSGDWPEEHESDNCGTEAVFMVSGSFDFRIQSIALGGGKTSLAPGEIFSVDIVAYNAGDNAPRDTRVGYYLSGGNLPGSVLIGTDDIQEESFTAGTSKSETISGVDAPTEPGAYTLLVCADYDNRVQETDEGNNCRSFPVTVTGSPPPLDPSLMRATPAILKLLFN